MDSRHSLRVPLFSQNYCENSSFLLDQPRYKTRQRIRPVVAAAVVILLLGVIAAAQIPTGSIVGSVVDKQGLVVSDAHVEITNQDTGAKYTTTTSALGAYEVLHLAAGVYRIEIGKQGFGKAVITNVKVDAGATHSAQPLTLEVGPVSEEIEVTGGETLVQTNDAQVTDTIEKKQLDELPLLDRNPLGVTGLQAGVSTSSGNTAIGGQRTSFTNMTLDGINIQDNYIRENDLDYTPNQLFLGQVQEVTVTTQNGGADTGLGSSQVNMITPSGTNVWHGELFWFHRNSYLAGNDWFNNHEGIPRPHFLLNQAGGNIGGPLIHNKLFVYGAYELYDNPSHTPGSGAILLPGVAQGTFTYHTDCTGPQPTGNCPSGVQPGQLVQANLLTIGCGKASYLCSDDPAISAQIAKLPGPANDPTQGDGLNTSGYKLNRRNNSRLDNASTHFDYNASLHHSLSATVAWNRQYFDRPDADTSFDLIPNVVNRDTTKFVATAWRWNPRPTLTNEARFGFDLAPANFKGGINIYTQPYVLSNTIYSNPDPTFFFQGRNTRTYSWQDNASWSHRNHTISFGGLIQHLLITSVGQSNLIPNYSVGFSSVDGNKLAETDFSCVTCSGDISANDLGTANSLLSTLAGNISSVSQQFNVVSRTSGYVPKGSQIDNFSLDDYSLYVGDSWKVRRNLTATLGLRWEYTGRYNEQHGLLLEPVVQSGQTVQQTLLGNASVGFAGGSSTPVYGRDLDNFAPQVGFAWDPWANGKTSIRGGYSMHYVIDETIRAGENSTTQMPGLNTSLTQGNLAGNTITGNPPPAIVPPAPQIPYTFQSQWIQSCQPTPPNATPDFFSCNNILNPSTNLGFMVNPHLQTPYVQEWNVSVQKNVGWDTAVTFSYLGNRANRLYKGVDYNQVNIQNNGILADFLRARSNAFLSLNATGIFDPRYNSTIAGSQPLTVFSQLDGQTAYGDGGFLYNFFQPLIFTGEVAELANEEHELYTNYESGQPFPWSPNQYIIPGDVLTNAGSSNWNAGVIEVRKRSRHGLYLQANYTYSKVLTNGDGVGQTRFDPFLDNAQPGLDKRRAAIDLTHAFKTNFLYQLPIGKGYSLAPANPVLKQIVSGWNMGTILFWQSGAPYSILSSRATLNRSARANGRVTPDSSMSGAEIAHSLGVHFQNGTVYAIDPKFVGPDGRGVPSDAVTCSPLTTGGFCNPAPGSDGSVGRDAFNGPAFFDWDFSISKKTFITETKSVEFQASFFNLINHPMFAVGDQNVNSQQFGVINSTATTPRRIQFGLRLAF